MRRAVHRKSAASEMHHQRWYQTIVDGKIENTIKVEEAQAWSSRENGTQNSVQASNHNSTYFWKRASKNAPIEKIQTNSKTLFLENCSKLLTKEIRSATLHVDTTLGRSKKNRTQIAFFISQPYFDLRPASARLDSLFSVLLASWHSHAPSKHAPMPRGVATLRLTKLSCDCEAADPTCASI